MFLNDTVTLYFKKLIKNVNGLQDPLLGQQLNFKQFFEEFIQLLNHGRHHQVIISTVDSQPGKVKYYEYYKLTESP